MKRKPDLRREPQPGVSIAFFGVVAKFLSDKYGDRMIDIEVIRQHLEKIEHAYVRAEPFDPPGV